MKTFVTAIIPTVVILLFCLSTEPQQVSATFRGAVKTTDNDNGSNGNTNNNKFFLGRRKLADDPCKLHTKGGKCKKDTDNKCDWKVKKDGSGDKECKKKGKTCEQTRKRNQCQGMKSRCIWGSGQPMCITKGHCNGWTRRGAKLCRTHGCAWKKKKGICDTKKVVNCTLYKQTQCEKKRKLCTWDADEEECGKKDDGKGMGCYFLTTHKCSCTPDVCTTEGCLQQDDDPETLHFFTAGCSCKCPGT